MASTTTLEANTGVAYLRPVHIELISMALKREGGFGLKPAWVEEGTTAKIEFDGLETEKAISLANAAVAKGFESELAQLLKQLKPSRDDLDNARGAAWQAAHEEWSNRGLGGYRAWCANEGAEAAARFAVNQ